MATSATLSVYDYIVIAVTLAVPLVIGFYLAVQGRQNNTKEEYLLGGRRLHVFPVTLSLFVTFLSSTSLIGMPAETFTTGWDFTFLAAGMMLCYLVTMFTVVPVMYTLHVTSMYEYFQLRFGSPTLRLLVTLVGMVQKIMLSAIVLLSPALSIQTATGLPFWVSVVIVGLVGIIYTSIGGIRSVVFADVFQAVIIMVGVICVLVKTVDSAGGMGATWRLANEGGRMPPLNFDPDPRERHSFWTLLFGGMFTFFAYTFDQSAIQRICAIPSMTGARLVYAWNIPILGVYMVCVCSMGVVAYSFLAAKGCDPFQAGILTDRNQLMPFVALEVFKAIPGMAGLYLATIFSSSLSTFSSVINGLAANTVVDILKLPFQRYKTKESVRMLIAKIAVWLYGGVCIGLVFLAQNLPGTVFEVTMSLLGACGGPIVGVFFLGALVPWTNKIGAITGLIVSLLLSTWMSIGAALYGQRPVPLPPAPSNSCGDFSLATVHGGNISTRSPSVFNIASTSATFSNATENDELFIYNISYQHYGLTAWLFALIVGFVISLATCKTYPPISDDKLLFPVVRRFWRIESFHLSGQQEEEKPVTLQDHTQCALTSVKSSTGSVNGENHCMDSRF
ncbi:sodium-coupled monocarboxylate transporter 1-like [Haliotis asinina]|uniref:sodium-coupled monocarboxylate transporter 1-like n=1 Tax=Haliotis asinina TaxID=109174 RepID=UPI003531C604